MYSTRLYGKWKLKINTKKKYRKKRQNTTYVPTWARARRLEFYLCDLINVSACTAIGVCECHTTRDALEFPQFHWRTRYSSQKHQLAALSKSKHFVLCNFQINIELIFNLHNYKTEETRAVRERIAAQHCGCDDMFRIRLARLLGIRTQNRRLRECVYFLDHCQIFSVHLKHRAPCFYTICIY